MSNRCVRAVTTKHAMSVRFKLKGTAALYGAYAALAVVNKRRWRVVDARTPQGEDMDRASCVSALSRRAQAP